MAAKKWGLGNVFCCEGADPCLDAMRKYIGVENIGEIFVVGGRDTIEEHMTNHVDCISCFVTRLDRYFHHDHHPPYGEQMILTHDDYLDHAYIKVERTP